MSLVPSPIHGVRQIMVDPSDDNLMPVSDGLVLRGLPSELRFVDVYDNQHASLRCVTLTNVCEDDVHIYMPNSVQGIRWMQLRSSAGPLHVTWPPSLATNSVAWAREGGLESSNLRAMRHLAANLDVCTMLTIEPQGTVHLFVEVQVREMLSSALATDQQAVCALPIEIVRGDKHQHVTIPVSIRACEPELVMECVNADESKTGGRDRLMVLDVGDVVVHEHVARDVRVSNVSDIACFLQVRTHGVRDDSPLTIVDQTTHERVGAEPIMLVPKEARVFTLALEPRESHANFEQTVTFENANMPHNDVRVLMRANLLGAASDGALAVLSECPLDFGDCCGGQWTRQLLVLKNAGDMPLDVMFRSEKDAEATFQLAELALQRESADDVDVPDDDVPLGGTSSSTARVAPDAVDPPEGPVQDTDSDISSNASQAGSRAGSPEPRVGRDATSHSSETDAATQHDGSTTSSTRPSIALSSSVPSVAGPSVSGAPTSGHRAASYSVSALATSQPRAQRRHDPVAMLRGGGESQHNQLEELVMHPGAQYRIVVSYRPPRESAHEDYTAGRLRQTTFRLFLDYVRASDNPHGGRQRREIVCYTRTCTPFISVSPRVVDFGMADVGARKSAQVSITNHSELETRVLLRFVSKVLSMYTDEIAVPARQTVDLKMDFFPRRINESYRKQITVMNLLNRSNDQILEVRARNVDLQRVSFHSLFYRILTTSGSNFLDFGDVNIHSPSVRSFGIQNLCSTRLSLEMSVAHPEDLQLFVKAPQLHTTRPDVPRGAARKEQFLEAISTDTPSLQRVPPAKRVTHTPRSHVIALKRGSRGRATWPCGASVTYRDRSLLHTLAYLDLAAGTPGAADLRHRHRDLRVSRNSRPPSRAVQDPAPPPPPSAPASASTPPPPSTAAAGASPALTGTWHRATRFADPQDVAHLDLDSLIAALEHQPASLSTFFVRNVEAEERLVRTEINLQRALHQAITSGQLVPIGLLDVPPHMIMQVVAVYTPHGSTRPHIQGNARKQDSRIFLRLLEFDARRAKGVPEFEALRERDIDELPVRDLMVRSSVCRSMLELGQPHINFGQMDKGDHRDRKIWIQNRSEWALRYCIRKSGSIASGDIRLGRGRYGIVPGYGKRGVDFTFSPSLSGPFHERLLVENIADHDNDQAIILKANVRKVANFALDPSSLDFGTCYTADVSMPESVLLSNTTAKQRTFVVRLDDSVSDALSLDVLVSMSDDSATRRALSTEEEEEVETLFQKLKIASRKGNLDKLAKYRDRLTQLGVAIPSTAVASAEEPAADTKDSAHDDDLQRYTLLTCDRTCTLTTTIGAQSSQKLLVRVRPCKRTDQPPHDVQIPLQVHEQKNSDEKRHVMVHARVEC